MQFPSRRARVALLASAGALHGRRPGRRRTHDRLRRRHRQLTIGFAGTDEVEVTVDAGKVAVNGVATTTDADDVKALEVREAADGTEINEIDLSAVTAAGFPQLASTLVRAEGGNDDITGTQLSDRIEGGRQDDVMRGGDGDDTLVWNNGEGSDELLAATAPTRSRATAPTPRPPSATRSTPPRPSRAAASSSPASRTRPWPRPAARSTSRSRAPRST